MTEVSLNPTVDGYRGAIGKLVFKNYKGRTIVCRKPTFTKPPTPRQIARRELFKEAVVYAQSVLADPIKHAFYEPIAIERDTSVYWLAIRDFLKTPTIKSLDLSAYQGRIGNRIVIITQDNVGVVDVNVELTRTDGTNIERGKAVELGVRTGKWIYTATAAVALGTDIFIEAEAFDRPGHRTVFSANPIVGQDE